MKFFFSLIISRLLMYNSYIPYNFADDDGVI